MLVVLVLVSLALCCAAGCAYIFALLRVQIRGIYPDVKVSTLYDVLHDPVYRKQWDPSILDGEEICRIDANNDVGYYASTCFNVCDWKSTSVLQMVSSFLIEEDRLKKT